MTKNVIIILEVHVHIHTKDAVSMNIYKDKRAYKEKYQNGFHLTTISWNEQSIPIKKAINVY